MQFYEMPRSVRVVIFAAMVPISIVWVALAVVLLPWRILKVAMGRATWQALWEPISTLRAFSWYLRQLWRETRGTPSELSHPERFANPS
jgi:hypothetical protein